MGGSIYDEKVPFSTRTKKRIREKITELKIRRRISKRRKKAQRAEEKEAFKMAFEKERTKLAKRRGKKAARVTGRASLFGGGLPSALAGFSGVAPGRKIKLLRQPKIFKKSKTKLRAPQF